MCSLDKQRAKPIQSSEANGLTDSPELTAYRADTKLMWRNVRWIWVGNFGASICMSIIIPLMQLRLKAVGVSEGGIGLINSINLWAVSVLVMYFSWKSDHCVSRWGRRIPFLLISLPFIVGTIVLFPWISYRWVLMGLMVVHLYFLDMKNSTYPLLTIDCVPRSRLARINALNSIIASLAAFLGVRYGSKLADYNEYMPYAIGGVILTVASLLVAFRLKEPPIQNPTTERFTPWATMKVAWRDRRTMVLMAAIAPLNSFGILWGTWNWFYAKQRLGLTRAETGAAISLVPLLVMAFSYPAGWLIDRLGSYKMLILYWVLAGIAFFTTTQVSNAHGLIGLMFLIATMNPLYCAGEMILWKQINPAEVGSFTSTNSFLRNLYTGTLIFVSGWLITWTGGNYPLVFGVGFAMTSLSIGVFLLYRNLMRSKRAGQADAESPLKVSAESA